MGTAPFTAFIDIPSMLVVCGGSIAAGLICFPLRTMIGSPKVILKTVLNKSEDKLKLIKQLVALAPADGMIGTLLGLIMMLADMSDPSKLGAGMAVALIATLYGAIMANVFFCPSDGKLGMLSRTELTTIGIAIRGVMANQLGESPRAIEQKLRTFLSPKQRNAQ